jgi:hypothetical protein
LVEAKQLTKNISAKKHTERRITEQKRAQAHEASKNKRYDRTLPNASAESKEEQKKIKRKKN